MRLPLGRGAAGAPYTAWSAANFEVLAIARGTVNNDPIVEIKTANNSSLPVVMVRSGSAYGTLRGSVISLPPATLTYSNASAYTVRPTSASTTAW